MTTAPPQVQSPRSKNARVRAALLARLGSNLVVASIAFWLTWAGLFLGTITLRFDDLILRRELGGGYVLSFEFEVQEGIFVARSSRVIAPPKLPTEQLRGLAFNPVCIAGEVGQSRSAPHKWFVIDKQTGSVDWFDTKSTMESKWIEACGEAAPKLSTPASFRPIWGPLIIGGGVLAFIVAMALSITGVVLLIIGNARRATLPG